MKREPPKKINVRKTRGMTMAKFGYVFAHSNLHRKLREFRPGQVAWLRKPIEATTGRKFVPIGTRVKILSCYHVMDTKCGPRWIGDVDRTHRQQWGHSQHVRIAIRGQIFGKKQRQSRIQCLTANDLSRTPIFTPGAVVDVRGKRDSAETREVFRRAGAGDPIRCFVDGQEIDQAFYVDAKNGIVKANSLRDGQPYINEDGKLAITVVHGKVQLR